MSQAPGSTASSIISRRAAVREVLRLVRGQWTPRSAKPPWSPATLPTCATVSDLKRMMITVWLCTFPAMFFRHVWNVGYQANTIPRRQP